MQRPARLDALSRAVLRKLRVVVVLKKLRVAAPKKLRAAALKKLRAVVLKKLRVAALQKPSPAARKRPVRLTLPSLVVAGKRALGPNRLLISYLQSCLLSGICPIRAL